MKKMTKNSSHTLFSNADFKKLSGKFYPPVIVAEKILSPENMGAILRLAGNMGALNVWFVYDEFPDFRQYKINRRSSGDSEKVKWDYIHYKNLFAVLPSGYHYVAVETTPDATDLYLERLPEKTVFFVGNERFGLSDELLAKIDTKVYIPLTGPISSLNVSHALSVALFEWFRQMVYEKAKRVRR